VHVVRFEVKVLVRGLGGGGRVAGKVCENGALTMCVNFGWEGKRMKTGC